MSDDREAAMAGSAARSLAEFIAKINSASVAETVARRERAALGEVLATAPIPPQPARLRPLQALEFAAGRRAPGLPELPPAPHIRVAQERFPELDVSLDPHTRTYWCRMRPSGRPSYTVELLRGLSQMQLALAQLFGIHRDERPFDYFVVASQHPGVFNFGGDLELLALSIAKRDREALRRYATACIDVVYANYINYDLPIVTIALVQGDALGGGFEAVLSCDVVIAEKGVKFGFPEVLFNLFPGMGAFSLLSRKVGGAKAQHVISEGRLFTAEDLFEMGLVQVLAEPGEGEKATQNFVRREARRHNAAVAMQKAARFANLLEYRELERIVGLWVDTALALSRTDLRKMALLASAQDRRLRTC
jgi:DSF synthase